MTPPVFGTRSTAYQLLTSRTHLDRDRRAPAHGDGQYPEATIDIGGRQLSATDIRRLLETLPTIEQAKGLLMGYYGINAEGAFGLLRRWSQNHNVRVVAIGARLTEAATADTSTPFSAIRDLLAELNDEQGDG